MSEVTSLPACPKCGSPTYARHRGSDDGVRAAWAECGNLSCGERVTITFKMWVEHFRPRDPVSAYARTLTSVGAEL